jgi:hypothetical protein
LGDPSGLLGTPAVGYFSHCAAAGTDIVDKKATAAAAIKVKSIDLRAIDGIAIRGPATPQNISFNPS